MGAGQSDTWGTFLDALEPTWHYSWNWEVFSDHPDDVEFVPQLFGAGSVSASNLQNIIDGINADDVDYIIGFNEPDLSSQGNTTVDEALSAWGVMEQALKDAAVFDQVELVSPVVAYQYDQWLFQFLAQATVKGYTIDHVCMHKYVSNTNAETFYSNLKERYHKEVITSLPYAKVSEDPAFSDNKFIPFATNQVAGSEQAQTFEFVVEGSVPEGASYQIKKQINANGTWGAATTHDLVAGTNTRTVTATGAGFTRKVNVVFSTGDVYISSFKHNGVEQLTTTSQITHRLSDYGPIWLKEFAVKRTGAMIDNGDNFPAADVSAFMETLLRKLNADPEVFRYAWFNSNNKDSDYFPRQVDSLIFDIDTLQTTALGDYYKTVNGPSYEVKELATVDALAGSSNVSAVATNNHATWTHKVSVASSTGSGAEQVIELEVVSLPNAGANYRITKTTQNGGTFFGPSTPLTTGTNTITVTGTAFERTVTLQFNSGDITISGCSINGVNLLNGAFGNINNGPLTISIPDSDYARSLNVEFSSSNIEVDSFKLNNNELTAIAVDGYYPLYDTETAANFVGGGSSHTQTLGGVTYYMPGGLTLGETMFHGNYTGE
ncbi:MAG: glycoside hydrolase family protein [Puniceicoccaceae bacterium]|nr:glycoside hydrolase family protein [Puniceicoccaceae bacterium]